MSDEFGEATSMLWAFKRDQQYNGTPILAYPNLDEGARKALAQENRLLDEFWASEPDSLYEEDSARQAAIGYLILTGRQLHGASPDWQPIIAKRFTEASVELYGAPEERVFNNLLGYELGQMQLLNGNANVDQDRLARLTTTYNRHFNPAEAGEIMFEKYKEAAVRFANALTARHAGALAPFEALPEKAMLSGNQLADLFETGLQTLAAEDPAWRDWKIVRTDDNSLSTDSETKEIRIGLNRAPATALKAKQLFCHEALIHAQRSVNGSKTGDRLMEHGLPDFLDSEEGLATFVEFGISGGTSKVPYDRYMDFGLTLGIHTDALTRNALHQLYVDRRVVRAQAAGKTYDEAEIERNGWRYVNRIYRGSPGGEIQAINTKDLAYFAGFSKISEYVNQQLAGGANVDELLTYILAGKFDPTNPRHQAFVARKLGASS